VPLLLPHFPFPNGFGSFLAYYPSADTVNIVLSNVERTPVSDFARLLAQQCDAATSNGRPE
jgi:hypothetical protein